MRAVVDSELDEARALAEAAPQGARETRLQRVVERLKARLEQYRLENEQLEEMLQAADARYSGAHWVDARLGYWHCCHFSRR